MGGGALPGAVARRGGGARAQAQALLAQRAEHQEDRERDRHGGADEQREQRAVDAEAEGGHDQDGLQHRDEGVEDVERVGGALAEVGVEHLDRDVGCGAEHEHDRHEGEQQRATVEPAGRGHQSRVLRLERQRVQEDVGHEQQQHDEGQQDRQLDQGDTAQEAAQPGAAVDLLELRDEARQRALDAQVGQRAEHGEQRADLRQDLEAVAVQVADDVDRGDQLGQQLERQEGGVPEDGQRGALDQRALWPGRGGRAGREIGAGARQGRARDGARDGQRPLDGLAERRDALRLVERRQRRRGAGVGGRLEGAVALAARQGQVIVHRPHLRPCPAPSGRAPGAPCRRWRRARARRR